MNRPPKDINPAQFFEQWLPDELSKSQNVTESAERLTPITVGVSLDGDGGGVWALHLEGGKLTVTASEATDPKVALAQTVEDWRAIVVGDDGPVDLAPPGANSTDFLFVDPEAQKLLAEIKGSVTIKVDNYNGRTWLMNVTFSGAKDPSATITIEAETYAQILSGELPAPQAFFSGKVQFSGDISLAMQVGMAMMSRMQ